MDCFEQHEHFGQQQQLLLLQGVGPATVVTVAAVPLAVPLAAAAMLVVVASL